MEGLDELVQGALGEDRTVSAAIIHHYVLIVNHTLPISLGRAVSDDASFAKHARQGDHDSEIRVKTCVLHPHTRDQERVNCRKDSPGSANVRGPSSPSRLNQGEARCQGI